MKAPVIPSGTPRGISINERRNFSVEMLRDYAQHDIFARLEEHFQSRYSEESGLMRRGSQILREYAQHDMAYFGQSIAFLDTLSG